MNRILPSLLAFGCLLVLIGSAPTRAADPPPKPVPPVVRVSHPVADTVVDYEEFTGRTEAVDTVEIRPRVTGYLEKVFFKEGALVKKGDVLYQIDPRPYQAKLEQAHAELLLAEAQLKLARAEWDRMKAAPGNAVSRGDLDRAESQKEQAEAQVKAARAGEEVARLTLDFAQVRSPIDGRIGRTLLTIGNLVNADTTTLTTIVSLDPMYVFVDLPESAFLRLRQQATKGDIQDRHLPVSLRLAGEEGYPRKGQVDFVDNRVDASTGTIRVRAVFANADGVLVPGLFCRLRLPMSAPHKVLVVPNEAVSTDGPGQRYVLVVNDQDVAEKRTVTLGQEHEGRRAVEKGLTAEDWVIVKGAQRVEPGEKVKPERGSASTAPPKEPSPEKPTPPDR